jgi:uncharacterized membrane protein
MNKKNLIPRILSLPFMLFILLIPMVILYFKWIKNYFLYGGEVIAYEDKNERKTIKDLYNLMKDESKSCI